MIEVFEPSRHLFNIGGRVVILTRAADEQRLTRLGTAYRALAASGDHRVKCTPMGSGAELAVRVETIAVVCDTMDEVEALRNVEGSAAEVRRCIMAMAGLPVEEPRKRHRPKNRRGTPDGANSIKAKS